MKAEIKNMFNDILDETIKEVIEDYSLWLFLNDGITITDERCCHKFYVTDDGVYVKYGEFYTKF